MSSNTMNIDWHGNVTATVDTYGDGATSFTNINLVDEHRNSVHLYFEGLNEARAWALEVLAVVDRASGGAS